MLSVQERIEINQASFTESDTRIYEAVKAYPGMIERYTVQQLATFLDVSTASVIRFAKRLGYSGYSEFRYDYIRAAHAPRGNAEDTPLSRYTRLMTESFKGFYEMDEAVFTGLCRLLAEHDRIIAVGSGKSGLSAAYLAYTFMRVGKNVLPVTDSVMLRDLAKSLRKGDLVLYFSEKANTFSTILASYLNDTRQSGFGDTVLITCNPDSPFRKEVLQTVVIPNVDTSQEGVRAHALFIGFCEILLSYYLETETARAEAPSEEARPAEPSDDAGKPADQT